MRSATDTPPTMALKAVLARLRGSALFATLRMGGAGLGFVTQVVLANLLGAHDLGIFYSATSLASVAGVAAAQGYPQIAGRFAARYRDGRRSGLYAAFVAQGSADCLRVALGAALLIVALSAVMPGRAGGERLSYAMAGPLLLAAACLTLYTNLAGAMRLFGLCYLPEGLVRPALFLMLVAAIWLGGIRPSGAVVTAAFAVLTCLIALAQFAAMRTHLPRWNWPRVGASRLARRWRLEARPLVLLALYQNFFADIGILFVTPILTSAEVAVFGLCVKLALLIGYIVQITQQMAVPDLADARERQDREAMQRLVGRSLGLPIAGTLAATAICVVFGAELLACFGPQFRGGRGVLVILMASQLLRACAGMSPHLLTLTGAQGVNARLCACALAVLFVSILLLALPFGAIGAAWAVLLSYAVWLTGTALALGRLGEMRTDLLALWPRRAIVSNA